MAGYSKKPLFKKLGIKEDNRILVINYSSDYHILVEMKGLSVEYKVDPASIKKYDFIHLFCKKNIELVKYAPIAKKAMTIDGMLWVSWPKKASGFKSDLNDMVVRNHLLHEIGLVDIKVAAVDDFWSALKFVYRLKDR